MSEDRPWYRDVVKLTLILVIISVATFGVIFSGVNLSEFIPKPLPSPVSITTSNSANMNLKIDVVKPEPDNQSAWILMTDGKRYARIPTSQSVLFRFRLNNTGSSNLEIWGTGIETIYPNGKEMGPSAEYAPIELLPGHTTTIDFVYGTNLPRFPGFIGGELILIVYGANQEWVNTQPVLLVYD